MARSSASSSARLGRSEAPAVSRVYLDYAGFAPVDPRVIALMRPFLEGGVGNPSAPHSLGLEARASLDGARAKVARLFGGTPAGVIFTASATEANNLAIRGATQRARGRHVVTSAIEHVSVLNACRHLEKRGNQTAIIWEGDDPKDDKKITYKELHAEVQKFANVLKKRGAEWRPLYAACSEHNE